jgi:hypothetical protein
MEIFREISNLVKIGQKYRTFYTKNSVSSVVAGDITSPQKRSLALKL